MQIKRYPMNPAERRAVSGLAGIFALRMLGLFLILPVFSLYAESLAGHTPFLVGLALGIYGLTQSLFQIPLGAASDRFGRKPVIALGLLVFALGSVVAALSHSIHGVIIGRALQGAGAIASAALALTADLTRDNQRTKAMAIIGITIGGSFMVSLLLGPILGSRLGVPGIFWLTAVAVILALPVLFLWVPTAITMKTHKALSWEAFSGVLRHPQLIRLNVGIFMLHCVLMALFVALPKVLVTYAQIPLERHWQLYVPVLLASVVVMAPFVLLADRKNIMRQVFSGAVLLLLVSQLFLFFEYKNFIGVVAGLFLFFVAFNFLEASLPSLVSRTAPARNKGAALGVYSTFEFFGAFVGGISGGTVYGAWGLHTVFLFSGLILIPWCVLAFTMKMPRLLSTRTVTVGRQAPEKAEEIAKRLSTLPGVTEAVVNADEGVAYLTVDDSVFEPAELEDYSVTA
ncbi:MAG: MFS transporter [Gammaproteobacteria bacterium]|nr:MFS transporter [Gammaproteobacteria bacterium]